MTPETAKPAEASKETPALPAIVWHTEKRTPDKLVPMKDNPRLMTEKQSADLTASLKKFNLASIPVINTDNVLISGHQRVRILQTLNRGAQEIEVRVPNRKLTDAEVRELNIRENKNLGEWDWDMLANRFDIGDLKDWGFADMELGGPLTQKSGEKDVGNQETGSECPKCGYKW